MARLLDDADVTQALESDLPLWVREDDAIIRSVTASTFAEGVRLVDQVAVLAEQRDHHPDIDIRWTAVTFRLSTHSAGGLTRKDLDLAAEIDQLISPSSA
jgi:4a-hydroxytetrahydrobiopterin dehydratase